MLLQEPGRYIYNPVSNSHHFFRLSFITLTISQRKLVPADEAYKNLLKPFLRKLRGYGKLSYIWKAEYQKDTDFYGKAKAYGCQLHYHIASNLFVPWTAIRNDWNNIQRRGGYLKEYALRYKSYDPNSTDIHSLDKVHDIGRYLGKYLEKTNSKKIVGKVWDCSTDLKRSRFSFVPCNFQLDVIERGVQDGSIKIIDLDHCKIIKLKNPARILMPSQNVDWQNWRSNISNPVRVPARIITKPCKIKKEEPPSSETKQISFQF